MQRRRHVRVSVPAGTMPSSPQGYAGPDTSRMDQGLPAKYWEGDTQQQARVSRMAGAGSQVGPPQFNPDPNIAAVGLGTVRRQWPSAYMPISDTIIYTMSSVADEIPAWGTAPRQRDVMLRNFWPTEPFLASAVMAYASKYTALTWTIEGPDTVADPITEMLHTAEHGKGWNHLMMPTVIDMLTQDNGGWWEIVRLDDDPMSPCVTLNHLDSGRCIRTGQWEEPIVYIDILDIHHRMK